MRERSGEGEDGHMSNDSLTKWTLAARQALAAELGVDVPDIDLQVLLDLARDAAHAVDRPAAPVTTYLLGYAAALAGGGDSVNKGHEALRRLAAEWDLGLHQS